MAQCANGRTGAFAARGGGGDAPIADWSWQKGGALEVQFDASASHDPDGSIVQFDWAFGDGDSGDGSTPTRTYDQRGAYEVTLTVTIVSVILAYPLA